MQEYKIEPDTSPMLNICHLEICPPCMVQVTGLAYIFLTAKVKMKTSLVN